MATFPELEPHTRSYDFGLFPLTEEPSLSAGIVRFRHSTTPQNYQLTLGYNAITDAQATLIRNHYQGQGGGYRSFLLPAVIWQGHTSNDNIVSAETLWRYSETPEEEHLAIGRINVTIALVSDGVIPPTEAPGFTGSITTSITAGAATGGGGYDSDAAVYIAAVEAADGQSLETGVKTAINNFVVGCKADGIWTAIKASCILAGARTLSGALVPLVGTAPTNNNFVSGDYNRETGLIGNGTSKYIDTNRLSTADGQNNVHIAVWQSSAASLAINGYATSIGVINTVGSVSATDIAEGFGTAGVEKYYRCRDVGASVPKSTSNQNGFQGVTRSSSANRTHRVNNANVTQSVPSIAISGSSEYAVFASNTNGVIDSYINARLAFYSIGDSLDLALLNTRVTALINAIAAAIP